MIDRVLNGDRRYHHFQNIHVAERGNVAFHASSH